MFQLIEDNLATKPVPGIWPCSKFSPEAVRMFWSYEPCPMLTDSRPPTSDWMLHLWNNPGHIAKPNHGTQKDDLEVQNEEHHRKGVPTKAAILKAAPKRLGRGIPTQYSGSELLDCWGIYCEEGFRLSWLFFALMAMYLFATLAFSTVWYVEHRTGPLAGFGSFGVAGWMVGMLGLIITTWFAAVKD